MKKCLKLLVLVIAIVIMTGCGSNESKNSESKLLKTCTLKTTDVVNGYVLDAEYSIYGSDNSVDKVITVETVTSDNEALLNGIKDNLDNTYSTMNQNYGGYSNEITNSYGKLVSKTTIDYNVMNLEKFANDNTVMKGYINSNNKFSLDGITTLYKTMGATCE